MATASDILIANMALSHLGNAAGQIESFTERSTAARQCGLWYDVCRREILESQDWSFARKRIALALHSEDPPADYQFRYQVPNDLLAARYIWNPNSRAVGTSAFNTSQAFGLQQAFSDAIPFVIESDSTGETDTLLTDQEDAILIYTFDLTRVTKFSPLFVNALSHLLASRTAMAITSKAPYEAKESQAYFNALALAASSNANQSSADAPRDAEHIRARL